VEGLPVKKGEKKAGPSNGLKNYRKGAEKGSLLRGKTAMK